MRPRWSLSIILAYFCQKVTLAWQNFLSLRKWSHNSKAKQKDKTSVQHSWDSVDESVCISVCPRNKQICNSKGVIRGDETNHHQPTLQLPSALNTFLASFSPLFWFKNAATTQFLLSLTSVLIALSDLSTSFVTYLLTYLHTLHSYSSLWVIQVCAGNTTWPNHAVTHRMLSGMQVF